MSGRARHRLNLCYTHSPLGWKQMKFKVSDLCRLIKLIGIELRGNLLKTRFFYICLFISILFPFATITLISKIPFNSFYTSYYLTMGLCWLYIVSLLGSIYIPVKYNFSILLKKIHIIMVVLYILVCLFLMNVITP